MVVGVGSCVSRDRPFRRTSTRVGGKWRLAFLIDGDGVLTHDPDAGQLYRSLTPLLRPTLERIVADQRFRRVRIESVQMPELAKAVIGAKGIGNIKLPVDHQRSGGARRLCARQGA
jgi:hypothetical protein